MKLFETFIFLLIISFFTVNFSAQEITRNDRGRAKDILNAVKNEIRDNYYDSNFHGIDLDARFKAAEEKIETAKTLTQAFSIIAQTVVDLNDSHTVFFPPSRAAKTEYGWRMQMFGNKCLVTTVRPKSDAEKKGLKIGDEIVNIENFAPTRKEFWKMNYYYNVLDQRPLLNIKVKSPNETTPRDLQIITKVTPVKAVINFADILRDFELSDGKAAEHRFVKVGNTLVWNMPTFAVDPTFVDSIMKGEKVRQAKNLILDLRGNGGGYVVTLEALAGFFVDKETKIADLKGRKKMKPQMAKSEGKNVYSGNLIVLIDSDSGSASEIFARFVQIQQRGVVIGDQSAGAVMMSRGYPMQIGAMFNINYGMSITEADVIMTDGKSLEHVGVTPQLLMIPKPIDVATTRDPVLAAAFQLFGEKVTPEQAGKFFPFDWSKID